MFDNPKVVCADEQSHHTCGQEQWRLAVIHTTSETEPVIGGILDKLEQEGYSDKEIFGVRLALEEALVNASKHGNRGDSSKSVQIRYHVTPSCVVCEVEDGGMGFKPEEVPDPLAPENLEKSCGRGLLLMRSYMTWVRYNTAGNRVTMCKRHGDV